jgi:4-amino-4-deoxy-L-arabinose transferase-like glycosyltransferase
LVQTHGEFWNVGIGHHVVARGMESFEGHGAIAPYYYFVTALVSLFPWIAFTGDGIRATRQNWNAKNAFLVSWAAGTYLLFTIYLTKLPHYVLPAFPALFLLLGQIRGTSRWTTAWFWLVIGIGLALAGSAFAVTLNVSDQWRGLGLGLTGIVAALAIMAVYWRTGRIWRSLLPLVVLVLSVVILGLTWRRLSPAVAVHQETQLLPATTRCGWLGYQEPSLVFYTARRWQNLGNVDAAKAFLSVPGPCLVVAQERETRLEDWLKKRPPREVSLDVLDDAGWQRVDVAGLNMARVSWVELRLYYRTH